MLACLLVVSLLDCYIMRVYWHVALFILSNVSCIEKCIDSDLIAGRPRRNLYSLDMV